MKILFFDDRRIITRRNTERVYGTPKLVVSYENGEHMGLPVVLANTPLAPFVMFYSVIKTAEYGGKTVKKACVCLSVSDDAINWRPKDNTAVFVGKYYKNQILPFGVAQEITTAIYEKETGTYRVVVCDFDWEKGDYLLVNKMFVSGDACNFSEVNCMVNPVGSEAFWGSFYNKTKNVYSFVIRPNWADRRAALTTTEDFRSFTPMRLIVQADSIDEAEAEVYGMPTFDAGDVYIGFVNIYHTPHEEYGLSNKFSKGHMDFQLAYSYDGECFQRSLRRPFINRGDPSSEYYGMIFAYSAATVGDDVIIYSGGTVYEHGTAGVKPGKVFLHTVKRDRFIGLESANGYGYLRTRGLLFGSEVDLYVNISVPYGEARARIIDEEDGKTIGGFDFSDCKPYQGDCLKWSPEWSGAREKLKNRVVSVEIKYYNGILW